ncbi:MAG: N-6 DNA methylase [Clostridia bacterium]|nr:N-6 DNA methylase [Clostridia bacterium]
MAFSFDATIQKLQMTPRGKEASMYGPIRDLFIHILKYPAADVDIDVAGEGGRPDVTARAPSGLKNSKGGQQKIDWVVVEAKDERGCFADTESREKIFSQKSKYITSNTAWFVMVEPEMIVVRQVIGNDFAVSNDIEIPLADLSKQVFLQQLDALKFSLAGIPYRLKKFREGDVSLIAAEKLTKPENGSLNPKAMNRYRVTKKRFYDNVRDVTSLLQIATRNALEKSMAEIERYQILANDFGEKYKERERDKAVWYFNPHFLTIEAKPQGPDATRQHYKDAAALRKEFKKNPHVARLALDGLPSFQARTGAKDEILADLFCIETANLILARILLLRFFEDNGFFGELKYVCNGGVKAFQTMREYFKASYTRLLEEAYRNASQLYAAAFEETEMDWVLGINDQGLSNAIEWAMFQLSRYDFSTIKGDILTGIYDRFMDQKQRKKLGEYYTPPSIARYIVKRIGIDRSSRVLDPSCGSGTFLIESYREMVGNDIERGAAEYTDALDALTRIAGNDLNTFSSVLAQIQLLWQVLGMKEEIEANGFPDIMVTGKINSLIAIDQMMSLDRFGEISQSIYDAVIGNPPYVRSERSGQDLDDETVAEFTRGTGTHKGISVGRNAYALFIYKALSSWCKPINEEGQAGKLGFVIQSSLFDAQETKDIRKLFQLGGRWTICEIVDLEIIYRKVFDADVMPAIVIMENRPPTEDDVVSIRHADHSCVKQDMAGSLPSFDIEDLPEQKIPYTDLFTPDGRIMTRLTPGRLDVIRKIWRNGTLREAAKKYWLGKRLDARGKASDTPPHKDDAHKWDEREMITRGIVFRNKKSYIPGGHRVYKGENIISAELQGDPVEVDIDLTGISDSSLWSLGSLLPRRGFAAAGVAHSVNAVEFDSSNIAFTDTASLFFPRDDLQKFPFDLYFLSHVSVFYYAIAARMGVLRTLRSHIYPTNLALMPWSENLKDVGSQIEALRLPIVEACQNRFHAQESLQKALEDLNLSSLKNHLRDDKDTHIFWAECFDQPNYEVEISNVRITSRENGEFQVSFSYDLLEWVELNRQDLALGLVIALKQLDGEMIKKKDILNLQIPVSSSELAEWEDIIDQYQEPKLETAMKEQLNGLDQIVGNALGLDKDDIAFIQNELERDPFLKGIRPRYPGTTTRKQGLRTGLSSSERYQ